MSIEEKVAVLKAAKIALKFNPVGHQTTVIIDEIGNLVMDRLTINQQELPKFIEWLNSL